VAPAATSDASNSNPTLIVGAALVVLALLGAAGYVVTKRSGSGGN